MEILRASNRIGDQSFSISNAPIVLASATIVGDVEGQGRFGDQYDMVLEDDLWSEDSWEKAECKMFENSVRIALSKAHLQETDVSCLLGGDLLNQIISANFAARQLGIPFLGLYGACSTMAESLLVGSMLISAGYLDTAACTVSSHFSSAERQYRYPLEYGNQRSPTAQRTVTGAGCTLIGGVSDPIYPHVAITGGTIGKVVDLGITDVNNMGAAMAPATSDTIVTHFQDTNTRPKDYDLIVTGDLGAFGKKLTLQLCEEQGIGLGEKLFDCGDQIFLEKQDPHAGGSGCGCSAVVLNSHLINEMMSGKYRRILFMATGALMSPGISQQGESIPGIAHAVVLERRDAKQ